MAAVIKLERTVAAIDGPRAIVELKKSVAIDRNVERVSGLADRAFHKGLRQASHEHALAWCVRQRAAIESRKVGGGTLEAGCIYIGDVVADGIDVGLSRIDSGQLC